MPLSDDLVEPFSTAVSHHGGIAQAIIDAVVSRTGVAARAMHGPQRGRDVTYARHLAMYLLYERGFTCADIGRSFGNRDHSTVLAGIRRIELERSTRAETAADVAALPEAG